MKKFEPGDWADHRGGQLDPREVVEVCEDGSQIKLWLLTAPSSWLPAAYYKNLGRRGA